MKSNKAFTLVEIMISLMIFSMVVVVALAALTRIIDANKKAQITHDSVSHISFVMEALSRELRTGSTYFCRPLPFASVNSGTDMNDIMASIFNAISTKDVSQCQNLTGAGSDGFGIAFLSNRPAVCPQTNDRLITAYQLVPTISNGVWARTFSFEKAFQTSCGGSLDFTQIISPDTYEITNYATDISDNTYPLFFLYIDGRAISQKDLGKTDFNLQIAATPRVP